MNTPFESISALQHTTRKENTMSNNNLLPTDTLNSAAKPAVCYCRFSSDMQHETSIEAQLEAIYRFAEQNGYDIVEEYIDRAKSGTTTAKRESFNQMIIDSQYGNFQYVIVHKFDRFSRNKNDSAIAKSILTKNNVRVISVLEPTDASPEGELMEGMLEILAQYYSSNLGTEVMKGFKVRAKKCLHNGGKPPLGYDVDPVTKKLILNPTEAATVKTIFEMYIQGIGYNTIIKTLNERGCHTKSGKEFCKNTLHDIIRNKKYAGYYIYNQWNGKHNRHKRKPDDEIIEIKGGCPAIISEDTYNKAAEMMAKRKLAPGTRSARQPYLLSGLVRCGCCGYAMSGTQRKNGKGYLYRSYRCKFKQSEPCRNREIRADKLEEFILAQLEKYIFDEKNISSILKGIEEQLIDQNAYVVEEIKTINRILSKLKERRKNITNAIANGLMEVDFEDILTQIRKDEELLTERLSELTVRNPEMHITEDDLKDMIAEFSGYVRTRNIPECKKFIDQFVKQVTVYENKVEVTLRVASFSMPDEEYTITKSIGRRFMSSPKTPHIL